jgi:flagellin
MAMVVKNNMSAVRTMNTLNNNSTALQKSLAKVSSGMKINSAQDDAAGYAISEKMRVRIRSLDQANQNTQNDSSMMKTAEGAVSSTVEILKALKEKAINAANDSNTDADRATIQKEMNQFIDQIDDNALTSFNGKYLVDGSKNYVGDATRTAFTNQNLDKNTAANDTLTSLKNRNGESLEITSTDKVTASYVKDGKTYSTTYQVGNSTLEDIFNNLNELDPNNRVFGPANLENDSGTSTATAVAQITLDSTGEGKLVNLLKGGTSTDDELTAASARVLSREGLIGNDRTSDYVNTTGQALDTLMKDVTATLKATTLKSGSTDTATSSIAFTVYNDEGGTETKTFSFSTNDSTTAKSLAALNSEEFNKMTDTLKTSVQNFSKFAFDTDTAAGQAFTDTSVGNNVLSDALKKGVLKASSVTNSTAVAGVSGAATLAPATAAAATAAAAGNGGGIVAAAAGADYAPVSFIASGAATAATTHSNVGLKGGTTPDAAVNYAVAYMTSQAGGSPVHAGSDIGLATSNDMTYTPDSTNGLTITALNDGVGGQIAGVNISITDSQGNVKKAANASLDKFSESIRAQNKSDDNALNFQVGAEANVAIKVGLTDMRSEALGLKGSDGQKLSVATKTFANAAVNVIDNAIQKAVDQQTTIGASLARLEYTSSNLTTSSENVQAAESTIRDADMAKEMTNYTKNNVLLQAAQSMLAQANQNSSAVLSLLQ